MEISVSDGEGDLRASKSDYLSPAPLQRAHTNLSEGREVTMRNVVMNHTVKGVYVKTNPGNRGTGQISNIVFENFLIWRPIWWAVWIGPQQQHQPGWNWTQHQECSLDYPIDTKHCVTQPLVPIFNITLRNVTIQDPLLSPGVILCNQSRYDEPGHHSCSGILFDNVNVTGLSTDFPFGRDYQCSHVENSSAVSSNPVPYCFKHPDDESEELYDVRLTVNRRQQHD